MSVVDVTAEEAVSRSTPDTVVGSASNLSSGIYRFLRSIPTWFLWIIVTIWTLPTASLFANSFRGREAQRESVFWELFLPPSVAADGEGGAAEAGWLSAMAVVAARAAHTANTALKRGSLSTRKVRHTVTTGAKRAYSPHGCESDRSIKINPSF